MKLRSTSLLLGVILSLALTSPGLADTTTLDTPSGAVCSGPTVAPSLTPGQHAVAGYCNFTALTIGDSDNVFIQVFECSQYGNVTGSAVADSDPSVSRPPMQNRCRYSADITFPNPGVNGSGVPIVKYYKILYTPRRGTVSNGDPNWVMPNAYVKVTGTP